MARIVELPNERSLLHSPIALLLRDEFTGRPPLGKVDVRLQQKVTDGTSTKWEDSDISPVVSSEGIRSYPGLGRASDVSDSPKRYRVLIEADYYQPLYQNKRDDKEGFEFDVNLYNEQSPLEPGQYAQGPVVTSTLAHDAPPRLLPSPRYPFPEHIPVARGRVIDSTGKPMVDAQVSHGQSSGGGSASLADDSGNFAVAIRWPPDGVWPPNDVLLAKDAKAGDDFFEVNQFGALAKDLQITLQASSQVVVSSSASAGQPNIIVNSVNELKPGLSVGIEAGHLSGGDRRYRIASINPINNRVRLDRDLPKDIKQGTRIVAVFTVKGIAVVDTAKKVTLDTQLPKAFDRTTPVLILACEIDVSHGEFVHTEEVKAPNGFRQLTIQFDQPLS